MIEGGHWVLLAVGPARIRCRCCKCAGAVAEEGPGVKFELAACTVDPQSDQFDPSPLKPYMAGLGVKYFFEFRGEAQKTLTRDTDSFCAYCSRMRRGILYRVAREKAITL